MISTAFREPQMFNIIIMAAPGNPTCRANMARDENSASFLCLE
jgi:hypothetical protein